MSAEVKAVAVQSFGVAGDHDAVRDAGWYCASCVLDGVRKWLLDEPGTPDSLRLLHGTVSESEDETRCAGCKRMLGEPVCSESFDVVGMVEIAERLGVARDTVDKWRMRGVLPEPTMTVGGRPAWEWFDVHRWATATGRA